MDNWDLFGLRGIGSVDFEVKNVFVFEGCWVLFGVGECYIYEFLFCVFFFGIFVLVVVVVLVGIVCCVFDEFIEIVCKKILVWKKLMLNEFFIV